MVRISHKKIEWVFTIISLSAHMHKATLGASSLTGEMRLGVALYAKLYSLQICVLRQQNCGLAFVLWTNIREPCTSIFMVEYKGNLTSSVHTIGVHGNFQLATLLYYIYSYNNLCFYTVCN